MQTTSGIIDTANNRRHNALNGEAREGAIELLRIYNDHVGNVYALGFGTETKMEEKIDKRLIFDILVDFIEINFPH